MWKGTEKVCIVGICGISLSALAQVLHFEGHKVWGSDSSGGEMATKLRNLGIEVFEEHDAKNVMDADIVVYSSAVHNSNPELCEAKRKGLKILSRAEVLGELSRHYKKTIAIAGSHGKTTTTGMLSTIFINAGLDPTIHIGGNFEKIGGNVRIGKGDYFVTEACEYCDSYLKLSPYIGVILSVQADHLDYFHSIANVEKSFSKFALRTKKRGFLVANFDDLRAKCTSENAKCKIVGFSHRGNADVVARHVVCEQSGCFSFDCYQNGTPLGRICLSVPGEHNISNALCAIAVSRLCGIDFDTIAKSLNEFCGVERRFQLVGKINDALVYHDYAHHPTEIRATIKAARLVAHGRLFVVFQPHTYSRTKSFFVRFAKSLATADFVVMFPIYPARETPIKGITSDALADKIVQLKTPAVCLHSHDEVLKYLKARVDKNDMVLILGAGDIVDITKKL